MGQISRKQQEIQQREAEILRVAKPIVLREGLAALSMDRLANQLDYAKGTLYNHFSSKEEIIATLAIEALQVRRQLFEKASLLVPGSRQRMIAIGCACMIYATRHQADFAMELLLRNAMVWEKSSLQVQQMLRHCESACMGIVAGIVRDGISAGDLQLPADMTAEEFVFGLWSLTFGAQALVASSPSLSELGVADPVRSLRYCSWSLLNGFGWRPVMSFEESDQLHGRMAAMLTGPATV
jgi:AcrR family transcriptional regulator